MSRSRNLAGWLALALAAFCLSAAPCVTAAYAAGAVGVPDAAGAVGASAAGTQLATHALLTRAQLGSRWSVNSPAPQSVPPLTCGAFNPSTNGIARAGEAASPTYQQSSSGPFVSQVAYAYSSTEQAETVWGKVVRPQLVRCVASALANGSGSGVHFKVRSRKLVALPKLAAKAAGYRASGIATQSEQSIDVYLDMIVVGRGPVITAISISSFQTPPPRQLELRLARAATRLLPSS